MRLLCQYILRNPLHAIAIGKIVITLYREGNLKISVYADHNPPHFHVVTPEGESVVDLSTMMEIRSGANRKLVVKAIQWALKNQPLIEAEWNRLNTKR